jgi:hypothetical protein
MSLEGKIRRVYAYYLAMQTSRKSRCPDEEALVYFSEGRLSGMQMRRIQAHVAVCGRCAESIAVYKKIDAHDEHAVPPDLIEKVKTMLPRAQRLALLDVLVAIREEVLVLLGANAEVMSAKEIAPLPVLRGRGITEFKEELVLVKELAGIKITLYIEKRDRGRLRVKVVLADRKNRKFLTGLRISLFKDNAELESYAVRSGTAIFEGLSLGIYTLVILRKRENVGVIRIEIK